MPTYPFSKMHGAGNDYVYLDGFQHEMPEDIPELARQISDRHFGVGGDGLVLILPSARADARMRMFNSDGSEAEMCGNAIRCVAKYVHDHGLGMANPLKIETLAGILDLELLVRDGQVERVCVDMGLPRLAPEEIPTTLERTREVHLPGMPEIPAVTCVSMGNPHCVVFVPEITDELVLQTGPKIETAECFPQRINVEFVQVLSRTEVRQRTWERGSGETMACGTGASAVCVAGVLTDRTDRQLQVHLLGGCLELEWAASTNHVFKTGPAVHVFDGTFEATGRQSAAGRPS